MHVDDLAALRAAVQEHPELVVAVGGCYAEAQRERIFDQFYRLKGGGKRPEGTGMGLAICRGIVQAHGGTLRVETTPGGGATAERKVTLVSVGGGQAKVTVDGRAYTVAEGETFASDYRAVDLGNECASFESGTTPFTLCEGEAVLK